MENFKSDHALPTVAELHQQNNEIAFKHNELLLLLNKPVHTSWIKKHETVKVKINGQMVPLQYLPIDKVRFLLTRIFGLFWYDEIVKYSSEFNSCCVHIRLHYCIPGTNKWLFKDGVGAVGVQTNKDASAADLSAIKANGVMLALPAAASYALSNAAEKLGDMFGANLNKSDAIMFAGLASTDPQPEEPKPQPAPTNMWAPSNPYEATANNHSQPFNYSAL